MATSVVRVERTGPTTPVSRDCQTQANRVIPPSTCSSKQTSAVVRPVCGRAIGVQVVDLDHQGRAPELGRVGLAAVR